MKKKKIIIICGPTGIGKTGCAIELAQKYNGKIISADSMQIYKYLDIGTAKPTASEKSKVEHYLVDIIEPDESFDAARFSKLADSIIEQLHKQSLVPFIVGGTGLYIKALVHGLFSSQNPETGLREQLKREAAEHGSEHLYDRLKQIDPAAADKLHPNDAHRIIRAIEIAETTGKSISEYQEDHGFSEKRYRVLKIGLHMEREVLYDRINRRVDIMIEQGLVDEVKGLLQKGFSEDLKSMQSIGYRHMTDYLKGRVSWEEAVRILKRDTRRYAKRQMTWFRADDEIVWTNPEDIEEVHSKMDDFLKNG